MVALSKLDNNYNFVVSGDFKYNFFTLTIYCVSCKQSITAGNSSSVQEMSQIQAKYSLGRVYNSVHNYNHSITTVPTVSQQGMENLQNIRK